MGGNQMRGIADHFPINLNNENPGQPSPAVTPGAMSHQSRTPPLAPATPMGGQLGSHSISSRDFLRTPGLPHTPGPSTPPVAAGNFLTNPMEQNYDQRLLEQQRLAEHRQRQRLLEDQAMRQLDLQQENERKARAERERIENEKRERERKQIEAQKLLQQQEQEKMMQLQQQQQQHQMQRMQIQNQSANSHMQNSQNSQNMGFTGHQHQMSHQSQQNLQQNHLQQNFNARPQSVLVNNPTQKQQNHQSNMQQQQNFSQMSQQGQSLNRQSGQQPAYLSQHQRSLSQNQQQIAQKQQMSHQPHMSQQQQIMSQQASMSQQQPMSQQPHMSQQQRQQLPQQNQHERIFSQNAQFNTGAQTSFQSQGQNQVTHRNTSAVIQQRISHTGQVVQQQGNFGIIQRAPQQFSQNQSSQNTQPTRAYRSQAPVQSSNRFTGHQNPVEATKSIQPVQQNVPRMSAPRQPGINPQVSSPEPTLGIAAFANRQVIERQLLSGLPNSHAQNSNSTAVKLEL